MDYPFSPIFIFPLVVCAFISYFHLCEAEGEEKEIKFGKVFLRIWFMSENIYPPILMTVWLGIEF